jgi:MFS family permease
MSTNPTKLSASVPVNEHAHLQRVPLPRLLACLLPATTAMYALYQGIQQVLIPLQVQRIDPSHKIGNLALLTAIAAVTSLLALPIGGAISDRTTGRFGRRAPWLVAAALASFAAVVGMGYITAIAPLAAVYAFLWFTANFYQGAWSAILPDRVPVEHRGIAASVIGFGTPLGILIGVNFVAQVSQQAGYIAIGAFLVATTLLLVIGAPEGQFERPAEAGKSRGFMQFAGSFFSGFAHRNFALAFISRFLLYLAYFVVTGYLLYTLQDWIGVENLPKHSVAVSIGILVTVNTCAWIVVAGIVGWIADKLDRRKLFVGIAAVGMSATMLIPMVFPTWYGMIAFAVCLGSFKGAYLAVDLALMSLVLPNQGSEGRDMGLLSVATGAPQLISGIVAGGLITYAGGYIALYVFGACIALLAGVSALFIRGIR